MNELWSNLYPAAPVIFCMTAMPAAAGILWKEMEEKEMNRWNQNEKNELKRWQIACLCLLVTLLALYTALVFWTVDWYQDEKRMNSGDRIETPEGLTRIDPELVQEAEEKFMRESLESVPVIQPNFEQALKDAREQNL